MPTLMVTKWREKVFKVSNNSLACFNGENTLDLDGWTLGIIKTKNEIQGVVLKGVSEDFDPKFLESKLIAA
ncbi:hypothetical protein N9Y89_00835 [bacterium]|nr:hypothetical protein [bacterium]